MDSSSDSSSSDSSDSEADSKKKTPSSKSKSKGPDTSTPIVMNGAVNGFGSDDDSGVFTSNKVRKITFYFHRTL